MASEITIVSTLSFAKGTAKASFAASKAVTMTGVQYVHKTQTVGASEETVDKGDIATIGYAMFRNTDATNFVELGSSTGVYSVKLGPGESAGPMRWDGANVLAKADTAPCIIDYLLIEA